MCLCFFSLLLMMFRSRFDHPWLDLNTCLKSPSLYDGALVNHYREPRIGRITADGFWLIQKNAPRIFVQADTTGLIENEYVGLVARFNKEGKLFSVQLAVAHHRREKIILSLIPTVFVMFMLFRRYKIGKSPFVITRRTDA